MPKLNSLSNVLLPMFDLWLDTLRFIRVSLRPRCALAAENLFLRKQLAFTWNVRSSLVERRRLPS